MSLAQHLGTTPAGPMKVMKKKGKKPIKFRKGGLHASTHTPPGKKIPASKRAAAKAAKYGKKAEKQELFAENVLKH